MMMRARSRTPPGQRRTNDSTFCFNPDASDAEGNSGDDARSVRHPYLLQLTPLSMPAVSPDGNNAGLDFRQCSGNRTCPSDVILHVLVNCICLRSHLAR